MSRRPVTASPSKSPKKIKVVGGVVPTSADYENMLNDQQHQMSMQISEKEIEIDRLKTSVEVMNNKCCNFDQVDQDLNNRTGQFQDSEVKRVELQEKITKITVSVNQDNQTHSNYQQELIDRINQLQQTLESEKQDQHRKSLAWRNEKEQMQADFHQQLQNLNAEKEQVRAALRSELEQVRAQLRQELESVRHNLKTELEQVRLTLTNEKEEVRANLRSELEQVRLKLSTENEQVRNQLQNENEQMRISKDNEIANLQDAFERYRKEATLDINDKELKIQSLTQQVLSQKTTIIELNALLERKADVESQLAACQEHNSQLMAQKNKAQADLDQATDYIISLEEKVYKANKTSLELLKQLKDAEVEIETLKQYIIDLKQRIAVYIPVKEDAIDRKLAEFINNYPERSKLKIMFMRESEGVYQFGTKRVAVKVEKDNIKIRVGGGYLSLDEFLDQYTPVELEKLERKDPLKRFSEKIAVQKTIVNQGVRESSPVRSPGRSSPKRNKLAV